MTTTAANQAQIQEPRAENRRIDVFAAFVRQMSIPTWPRLRSPLRLYWWEWCKLVGIAGFIALATFLATGNVPHPAVVAVLLHVTTDFTLQSWKTNRQKAKRGRCLLVHALAAGGLPLAVAGCAIERPITVITWATIGATSHYAVDWTRKFGLQHRTLGCLLDQTCHLLTILVLTLTG